MYIKNHKSIFDLQTEVAFSYLVKTEMSHVLKVVAFNLKILKTVALPCNVVEDEKFKLPLNESGRKCISEIILSAITTTSMLTLCWLRAGILSSWIGAWAT